jgi:hypothetical protein
MELVHGTLQYWQKCAGVMAMLDLCCPELAYVRRCFFFGIGISKFFAVDVNASGLTTSF